ncbi:MAG TPA: hypothetical protein VFK59_05065 [Actinomycetota bacterium]|nr:hypothetical protein [Actinomycetota bacterium]
MWWVWLLVLIPVAVWLAARRWRATRAPGPDEPLDPKERRALEDEIRDRHGGSGPTVAGGQHLG